MKPVLLSLSFLFIFFAKAQYTINGDAVQENCHCYQLTPNLGTKHGSVWNNTKINLTQSFTFNFDVQLSQTLNDGGADGIAFVLQPISTSVGGTGSGLGFQGIPTSLGVTLDTYQNGTPVCTPHAYAPGVDYDPPEDHIAIQLNGDLDHCSAAGNNVAGPVNISASNPNVEDGLTHSLKIEWIAPTKTLNVYFDGVFRVSKTQDFVATTFGGNPLVYWGFTGSTGGLSNYQRFCTSLSPSFSFASTQKKCVNEPIQFINGTTSFAPVAGFSWDFGDGSLPNTTDINPVHTYASGGSKTVIQTVTGADGCIETNTQNLFIGTKPIAAISASGGCINSTINFTDVSTVTFGTINNWYWDLGDNTSSGLQNPTDLYSIPGPKTIRLAVKSLEGCESDTVSKIINIDPEPAADFSFVNNSCEGTNVQFNDLSTVSPGTITSWDWNFGSGPNSNQQNPTHVFPAGTYTVTLTSGTTGGCSKTISKNITINPKPTAYFKYNSLCQSAPVTLTDSSYTVGGGAITQWWWDLGNTQTSTQQNPTATYNTAGPVTVKLVVRNAAGCISDTLVQTININAKPVASFTTSDTCVNNPVQFTSTSTAAGSTISQWYWDLDNGNGPFFGTGTPSATYSTYGIRNIKLTVKSQEACWSDTLIKPINIRARPISNFTYTDSVCLGSATFFTDQSTLVDGPIAIWAWTFDDSAFASHFQNPVHIFLTPGLHTVLELASATGGGNCLGTIAVKNVFIVNKPTAYFKTGATCQSTAVTLQDSSYTTDGITISSYWWDLGNNQFSTQQNPVVTYNTSGPVTIKHVVRNSHGCISDTFRLTINIQDKPIAQFGYSLPLCSNIPVQFHDSSKVNTGAINQWNWINNGTFFSSNQNPVTLLPAGSPTIGLIVSAAGCKADTVYKTILINPKPAVSFNFKDTCKNINVNFSANSPATIAQWQWTFGDGAIASAQNPTHAYLTGGSYAVSMFALSTNGCYSDTLKNNINIYGTDANAGPDIIAASGQPVQLNASGGITYEWTPAFGLSNAFISNPIATLTSDQTYSLKALTPQGCESYDQLTVKIYKGPEIYVPSAFTPNGDGNNDILRALPVGISKFENFIIFNRYGQKIFSTDDYSKGWDGAFKTAAQNSGVYVWTASAIDFRGNKMFRKGTVLLIR